MQTSPFNVKIFSLNFKFYLCSQRNVAMVWIQLPSCFEIIKSLSEKTINAESLFPRALFTNFRVASWWLYYHIATM